jgi:DNA (cytosine-5)-methyltransferase 1
MINTTHEETTMKKNDKYTVVSLFSGGGGFDHGLNRTGHFKTVACLEFDKHACDTLEANRAKGLIDPDTRIIQCDISTFDPNILMATLGIEPGDIDLVVGGPPCQSFSTAGKRKGTQDPRGRLIYHFLEWVDALKPKFFVMENVRGLLTSKEPSGNPTLDDWVNHATELLDTTYGLQGMLLDAFRYGVAQHRPRVVIIGSRSGDPIKICIGPQGNHPIHKTLRDAIGDLCEDEVERHPYGKSLLPTFSLVPPGGNWRDLPDGNIQKEKCLNGTQGSGWWRRLSWDEPTPTVCATVSQAQAMCHPTETRHLTVREAARVQGFLDEWTFCGGRLDKHRQVGNAVPVPLAESLGIDLAFALGEYEDYGWTPFDELQPCVPWYGVENILPPRVMKRISSEPPKLKREFAA